MEIFMKNEVFKKSQLISYTPKKKNIYIYILYIRLQTNQIFTVSLVLQFFAFCLNFI